MVLGEMDAAWVNSYRFSQGERPLHLACYAPPPASGGHPIPVVVGGGGLEVSLLPGERRLLGLDDIGSWGMGDDFWRGQKERSLES